MKCTVALGVSACVVCMVFLARGGKAAEQVPNVGMQDKMLATANGVEITENDLELTLKRTTRGGKLTDAARKTFLETVVRNELASQAALALGLDRDPAYQIKLREAEAQLRVFRRENLVTLYRNYVQEHAAVTETDALAYFDQNAERLRTRLHVWQIAYRGQPDKMATDEQDLKKGLPFETVAARRYPATAKDGKAPWDLGFLHWSNVPGAWRETLDSLKPGETSGLVKGEGERLWLLRLVDSKVDPSVTFESEKERIQELLKAKRAGDGYEKALGELRTNAKVVMTE